MLDKFEDMFNSGRENKCACKCEKCSCSCHEEDFETIEYEEEVEDTAEEIENFVSHLMDANTEDTIREAVVQLFSYAYAYGVKKALIEDVHAKIEVLNTFNNKNK